MTTKNDRSTDGSKLELQDNRSWLQTTLEQAEAYFKKEEAGGKLTADERAACSLKFGIQTAAELVSAVCYAGQDIAITGEQHRLWLLGNSLTTSEPIGLLAFAYGLMLTAVVETPGAIDATFARLRKDLSPALDSTTIRAIRDAMLTDEGRHG